MKKRKKFKIPNRTDNRVALLEDRYKETLIKVLQKLYPDEDFPPNSRFSRIAVTDVINPLTHKKEYGVVFYCQDNLIPLVEAFDGIDDSVKAFCLEGLAVGKNLCKNNPLYKPSKFKAIICDDIMDEEQPDEIIVDRHTIMKTPLILSVDEFESYNEIFQMNNEEKFSIRIFNPKTNSSASSNFKKAKRILNKIPNTRVSRDF